MEQLERLRGLVGRREAILGRLRSILGSPGGALDHLGLFGGHLGRSGGVLGPSWRPSWATVFFPHSLLTCPLYLRRLRRPKLSAGKLESQDGLTRSVTAALKCSRSRASAAGDAKGQSLKSLTQGRGGPDHLWADGRHCKACIWLTCAGSA